MSHSNALKENGDMWPNVSTIIISDPVMINSLIT